MWRHGVLPIELHGTLASIRVPDPDTFGGDVELSGDIKLLSRHDPDYAAKLKAQPGWDVTPTDKFAFGG